MIGRSIGHYRIEAQLGAGDMAVVYRAFDSKLRRRVAIKFLNGVPDAESRARLLQEARAASALNHPNICTIREVAEADVSDFKRQQAAAARAIERARGLGARLLISNALLTEGNAWQELDKGGVARSLASRASSPRALTRGTEDICRGACASEGGWRQGRDARISTFRERLPCMKGVLPRRKRPCAKRPRNSAN